MLLILLLQLALVFIFWKQINIPNILPQISFIGVLGYLAKFLIEKITAINIEKIKSEAELENQKMLTIHNRLHTDRANIIKELYFKMVDANNTLISLTKPLQMAGEKTKEEKFKEVVDTYNDFVRYYDHNKIYFDKKICLIIDKVIESLRDPIIDYEVYYPSWKEGSEMGDTTVAREHFKELRKAWDKVKGIIPPLKESLEEEFRTLIGVKLN